jgi:hypothetical protein
MQARLDAPLVRAPSFARASGGPEASLFGRAWAALGRPYVPFLGVVLGTALVLPSLSVGLGSDDYIMLSQDRPGHGIVGLARGPWDLHVSVPRNPDDTRALMGQGVYAWWTDPGVRFAFLRPLTSFTHALDHALWPGRYSLWHLQSVLWFALALLGAALLFRSLFGAGSAASLALLLFALDPAHGPTVGWLASRNTVMAMAFCAFALWAHSRWRSAGWRPGKFLGPAFLVLGLSCGEISVGVCGYLAAHALFLDSGPLARRLWRLSGFGVVLLVWAVVYAKLNYGTALTTQYLHPLREPVTYLQQMVWRAPILLVAQLYVPWSNLWPIYPTVHPALPYAVWGYALLALAAIAAISWPRLKRDPVARFGAAGMVLAVLPGCAGVTQDRVLALAGFGAMALAGSVVGGFADPGERALLSPRRRRFTAAAVTMTVMLHGVFALYGLPSRARSNAFFAKVFERANATVPMDEAVREKTVVLVNPPFEPIAWYMSFERDALDQPRPKHLRVLATGASAVAVTRLDERTLRVVPEKGFLSSAADNMLRSPRRPLPLGVVAEFDDVTIEVSRKTPDDRPAEVLFHFNAPLEDPGFTWLQWGQREYVAFTPPSLGQTVTLPPVDLIGLFLERPARLPPPGLKRRDRLRGEKLAAAGRDE